MLVPVGVVVMEAVVLVVVLMEPPRYSIGCPARGIPPIPPPHPPPATEVMPVRYRLLPPPPPLQLLLLLLILPLFPRRVSFSNERLRVWMRTAETAVEEKRNLTRSRHNFWLSSSSGVLWVGRGGGGGNGDRVTSTIE